MINSETTIDRARSYRLFTEEVEVEAEYEVVKGLFMSYNPISDIVRICQQEYQRVIAIRLSDGKVIQDSFVRDIIVPDKLKARELYRKEMEQRGLKA